jgi:chromate transporter
MNGSSASVALALHLAMLSSVSFGGFPSVLPDVHNFVAANGWVTDREFADFFAVSQVMPGPNMILMMSLIGLKVGGVPGAIAGAGRHLRTTMRNVLHWLQVCGIASATCCGSESSGAGFPRWRLGSSSPAATSWRALQMSAGRAPWCRCAMAPMLRTRINPLWMLGAGGAAGGLRLL